MLAPRSAFSSRTLCALSSVLLVVWACTFPRYSTDEVAPNGAAGSSAAGNAGTAGNAGMLSHAGAGSDAGSPGAGGCADSTCESCPDGFGACDQDPYNGCETRLDTANDCGECGAACTNEHGLNACSAGQCKPTCMAGYDDCDLRPQNGCETSTQQDALNCGSCGHACPANGGTPLCVAGECGLSSCNLGFGDCNNQGVCSFKLNSDPMNCGRCGHVCSSDHGTPRCNGGVCESTCSAGYGDCNRGNGAIDPPNDGCETQLNQPDKNGDVANCGGCADPCKRRAYTTVNLTKCAAGQCFLDCMNGASDCDNSRNNPSCLGSNCGCEFTACN